MGKGKAKTKAEAVVGHEPGPGLVVLGGERWWGGGYCAICGHRGAYLVPRAVRYWDADDGWRVGVLCSFCGEDASLRGPKPGDFAYAGAEVGSRKIDVSASLGDLDSTYAEGMDER